MARDISKVWPKQEKPSLTSLYMAIVTFRVCVDLGMVEIFDSLP